MWNAEKKSTQSSIEPNTTSFFAPGFRMIGDIESNNDVRVEGIIQGNLITSKRIIIGKTGQVIGNVKGCHISIMGEVVGEVIATDITIIGETGVVHGTVLTNKIKIDPGAEVEACIKKLKKPIDAENNPKHAGKAEGGKRKENIVNQPELAKVSLEN
ncbi:bactofilin family protein [Cyclobacterium jeungdonense]|uniref:Polymer-forming cytoskeletal protein n=1 Tax=Cyclobacterium jeungdonense TaxID=708087 RepID=A0ABT8C7Q7_9BACT|nr:polymer-forming cytoskeletal protein [Cyclobacterium jeungdonense]MDN3688823.1 polymer-forming cytoskeletal protein [Cyclobacterium jeungdonense]